MPDTGGRGTAEDLPLRRAAAPEGARGQTAGRSKWGAGCIERCLSGSERDYWKRTEDYSTGTGLPSTTR